MANTSTNQLILQLQKLKKSVLKDGVIDWDETEQLRDAIRPLSVRRGYIFEYLEKEIMDCRKDGKITPEESRLLALHLDLLSSAIAYRRLKFRITIVFVALVLVTVLTLMAFKIISFT